MMTRLIPNIFYSSLADGLDLFVACLGFKVLYRDNALAVIERDGAKAHLVRNAQFAAKDRPEIIIETDTFEELYSEVQSKAPQLLHPNSNHIAQKPWGAREFAILDKPMSA